MAPRNEDDIDDAIAAELKSLNSEADELEFVGNFERALEVGKKALAIYERELGPDHSEVAGTLGFLAYLYYNLGQYAQAEPLYKRSLAISERPSAPTPRSGGKPRKPRTTLSGAQ